MYFWLLTMITSLTPLYKAVTYGSGSFSGKYTELLRILALMVNVLQAMSSQILSPSVVSLSLSNLSVLQLELVFCFYRLTADLFIPNFV